MRNNESKFSKSSQKPMKNDMGSRSLDTSTKSIDTTTVRDVQKNKSTLDAFLAPQTQKKESKLFDEYFGVADFRLLTKKALQENSVKN